ncbi:sensor domain-containing diguanylate cyclase [Noviherbaspirillum sedimenti]|uniref:diguanylate cyclase n=1 Tax=Noviherbaspirillum sedimenti TaxID=2320865 RepID=A0A3A3FY65_9BURK|nr:sensor domain-containing diguanylate cyclase [Noviherbaspirillum sedimenti]RJG01087.1 GGDEF domain-containing protein [Noviherbaspirillum sedimenti]
MAYYSIADKCLLLEKINSTIELSTLLDLLGEQIDSLELLDGYLINLLDASGTALISRKVHFTSEYQFLENTYADYKIELTPDAANLSVKAYLQKQIIQADIVNATGEVKRLLGLWKLEDMAAIPLMAAESKQNSKLPGTIVLLKQQGKITHEILDIFDELVALFHAPLCNALEYAYLKDNQDRLEAAAAEQSRFLQFIVEMNNMTSPDRIYDMFAHELFHKLTFDMVGFFLLENEVLVSKKISITNPRYEARRAKWEQFLLSHPYQQNTTDGGISHTFMRNTPLLFPDVQKIKHLPMSSNDQATMKILGGVRTLLMVPIRHQNHPIGVLTFFTFVNTLDISESDLILLNNLSAFLGTAIINGRNYLLNLEQHREIERLNLVLQDKVKELAEQASTDKLTGLFNFRTFELELNRRINEFERHTDKAGLSIAVIDIDHFKKFNDAHGHNAGNVVLAGVAREIGKLVRKMDLACRYGGEEFVVILAKCDPEGIRLFAERVRTAIAGAVFDTDAGKLSVTVSVGCTTHQAEDTYESLFKRADHALYRAKENGRNRIETA